MADAAATRQRLAAQRQRWMREREVSQERDSVMREDEEKRCSKSEQKQGGSGVEERVLARLTENIANRLRVELRDEITRETELEQTLRQEAESKMERFLTTELQNHVCPICYELMSTQEREPMMAIPCGHTFCGRCIAMHRKKNRSTCPYCRAAITSTAVNQSLKQLIAGFCSKRDQLAKQGLAVDGEMGSSVDTERVAAPRSADAQDYQRTLQSLDVRLRILENEREDTVRLCGRLRQREEASRLAQQALAREEEAALEELERARQALNLVQNHLKEQQRKLDDAVSERRDAEGQLALVESTMVGLERERDKAAVLAQGSRAVAASTGVKT